MRKEIPPGLMVGVVVVVVLLVGFFAYRQFGPNDGLNLHPDPDAVKASKDRKDAVRAARRAGQKPPVMGADQQAAPASGQ